MSDSSSNNTAKAIEIASTAMVAAWSLMQMTFEVQKAMEIARREGRDMTDEELRLARSESAEADDRFKRAIASLKA